MRQVTDDERRSLLATRHAIAPAHRVADPEAATRAVVVLHSTEPATVHLSVHARVDGVTRAGVTAAMEEERTLVKQLAMRRTLFVFPRDLLPATWGSAAARTAASERARLVKHIEQADVARDGAAWLEQACAEVLEVLAAAPGGLTAVELRTAAPIIDVRADLPSAQLNPGRVLTVLGSEGRLVRGENTQHWRVFRPRWHPMARWLADDVAATSPEAGYRELVGRWLARFGPGTEDDLVWWLGATKGAVRRALADLGAERVGLVAGAGAAAGEGWVLPSDPLLDGPVPPVERWAALLPVLDPTVMGWRHRDFYLGPHGPALFDRNGNAGTTAWVDGRVVGCWVQDPDGVVEVRLLEDVDGEGRERLVEEARRLTTWLEGERVGTVYPGPTMRLDPGDLTYPVLRA